ncbi:MAG: aldehyde dehydrogenase family protein [Deltaproteobacteria bacterium]|nr:aldehyde dehydrogenase family protein [Deltaproteobacteria bacterium]MBW2448136.1 aldehyde dehydrogenase family protein [Deltaproteobacteria bacterium]
MSDLNPETRNYIGGQLVGASSGATFENVNPATEEVIGVCSDGTKEDMDAAIAAARQAFDETDWSTNAAFRGKVLRQFHAALEEAKEELRAIVVAEAGSPILLTHQVQTNAFIDAMPYFADLAENYEYESAMSNIDFMGMSNRRILRHEAAGVVGAITPWNFPLYLNLCKIGPALAAGCTMVLKPPPDTPWCATALGRLFAEKTDLPAGVLNIVASSDHMVGEILTTDPRVDVITFTGSTATGRRIMECAAPTVKKVFLELGGKSANIVLDDADFAKAVGFAGTTCVHGGQGCAIPTRLLLPRSRYDEGVAIAKAAFENVPYGDPTDPSKLQGPQVSKKQQERVLEYIEKGKQEGAKCIVGGGVPAHLPKGYFVEPTLFIDVDPDSTIAQEEIFGPVLAVIPFDDDDDAVRIANNSIYGLSGAVSSGSEERALAVARRIRTGTLAVNGGMWFHQDTPFGGYKQSGVGRENGVLGFEEYLEVKVMGLPGRP